MPDDSHRDDVSVTLRRLRKSAGLTGVEAARQAGVSQPSISRWESGRNTPSLGDVRALVRVYRASPADRRALEAAVKDLRESPSPPARVTMRRAGDLQGRITRVQGRSSLLRVFSPILFHGTMQTADYARAVFSSGGDMAADQVEASTAERLRQGEAVARGDTRLVAVLAEGVLRWPIGSAAVMADQLAHVIELSRLPNVQVGVVPARRPVQVAPVNGFDLMDERSALVGAETVTAFLTDQRDVDAYIELFADVRAAAVFGDEARAEIEQARGIYGATT